MQVIMQNAPARLVDTVRSPVAKALGDGTQAGNAERWMEFRMQNAEWLGKINLFTFNF